MRRTSSRLWILEGPDGSGKSTLAVELAKAKNAHVVHCGPFLGAGRSLGRLYVEAMLPALLGDCDVVMDRSWLSEPIYAAVVRRQAPRLAPAALRMLERVAARCRTTVVRCLPPLAACLAAYRARRPEEYVKREADLAAVWRAYAKGLETTLPTVDFDYVEHSSLDVARLVSDFPDQFATRPHPLGVASAGYLNARALLVGEGFAKVTDQDNLRQYPFVSFGRGGCSAWLTDQLAAAGVAESGLLWANADMDLGALFNAGASPRLVVALGAEAGKKVERLSLRVNGIDVVHAGHPQYIKRFRFKKTWPLPGLLARRAEEARS